MQKKKILFLVYTITIVVGIQTMEDPLADAIRTSNAQKVIQLLENGTPLSSVALCFLQHELNNAETVKQYVEFLAPRMSTMGVHVQREKEHWKNLKDIEKIIRERIDATGECPPSISLPLWDYFKQAKSETLVR